MSLVMGRGWRTEIMGRDREEGRDKKFRGKKVGLGWNKKHARANRELWYRKVRGINGTSGRVKNVGFCWESWKQREARGQCRHNCEKKKYLL